MNATCSRSKTILPGAFLLLFGLLLAAACSQEADGDRPDRPENVDIRPDVIFSTADDRPLHIYIESQGIVEPAGEILIRPRVSGFVEQTALDDGRYIEQGETLIAFADEEWQHQLSQAQNEFEQAEVGYRIEWSQRENRGGSGGEEGDERMLKIVTGLAQAELDLERAQLDLSYSTIRASFSGFLSVPERISSGAYIAAGTELGRLIDDLTVLVRLDVLESELNRLERGMIVEITSPDGERREGTIRALSPVVDPESKTGQVIVEVANADRHLKAGMTVEGRVQVRSHSGIARVPRSAILERDGGRTLLFKLNGETVEWIYVEPEYMTSEWAVINHEELAPGDTVAVDRHIALSHLQNVRPRMAGAILLDESGGD